MNTIKIENAKEFFKKLKTNDPKIIVKENSIHLVPFYASFGFIINFFLILACIYILIKQNEMTIVFLCMLAIIISLFNIINQLRFYNKIIIDFPSQTVLVIPNFIFGILYKKRIVNFKNIKLIDYSADSIWLGDRRFRIRITSFEQKIKLISTSQKSIAEKIIAALQILTDTI